MHRWVEQKKKFTEEEAQVMQNVRCFQVSCCDKAGHPHLHDGLLCSVSCHRAGA
jgi:hypothetical protein